jgi:hypothetical protein
MGTKEGPAVRAPSMNFACGAGRCAAGKRDELAASHVWMAPAWQEITSRAAQVSLAVMCPACSRSPRRVGRIDRLDEGKPGGMALVHLERITGIVVVDREHLDEQQLNVLRVEVEQLRAMKREARDREEFLSASVNRLMESRDQWRREAERLCALIAQVPPWSLFWWSCVDAFKAWRKPTDRGLHCA